MNNVEYVRNYFKNELINENFTVDRTGSKTIELIGSSFLADEPAIFGTPNEDYIAAEIKWYDEQSTNINDISYGEDGPPKAWQYSASEYGEINSNYGHLIYSDKYYSQYSKCLTELIDNPDTRRGIMIYTRPSIWTEFDENGKNDFICTNAVCYYIRNMQLHAVVQMRSNDVVFGYKNDWAWAKHVQERLVVDLSKRDLIFMGLKPGNIYWQVMNLHVYERHFNLVSE